MAGRAAAGAAVVAALTGLAGCGGGGGAPSPTVERASSVGDGLSATPPPLDPSVVSAARKAGCSVRAFPADNAGLGPGNARTHVQFEPHYTVSIPPTSGPHYPIWADWGVYDVPVPYRFLVHNMEHGGIELHYGSRLSAADRARLVSLWRESPAFMIVVPDVSTTFPKDGMVVTSWQRWMACDRFAPAQLPAIRAYRAAYRGTGPEDVAGSTALSKDSGANVPGLPKPAIPDTAAGP